MKNIITNLERNKEKEYSDFFIVHELIDPLYDSIRDIVGENIMILNQSRILMRQGHISEGIKKYQNFKEGWTEFREMFDRLNKLVPLTLNKNLSVIEELITNSTERNLLSKIPVAPKKYLEDDNLNETDLDWIIGKIKDYWGKYSQIYSSNRLNYLLKISNIII
ncbi:hypothetical protein [Tenacibaculum maritimum]|uniref:hypothetical protein n=1 Tax=Tenacibaculum maritimum TaxID=107401 RepID=UPI00388EDEAE